MAIVPLSERLAGEEDTPAENIQYVWLLDWEDKVTGARARRRDRFGQTWVLDIEMTHAVTQRVAAGLLGVSLMSVNTWAREGRFGKLAKRNGVSVIPVKKVLKSAISRGRDPAKLPQRV